MRWLLYWIAWVIIRTTSWLLFGFKVIGTENVPRQGAFIYAVNHQSYVDPPMVAVSIPRVLHFFAKKELFENFLFGTIISCFNAIPVRRGVYDPKSLGRALEALKKGEGLMFFPEGTRGDGKEFLPPKRGIGMIAKQALLTRKRVKVLIGKPFQPEEFDVFSDDKEGYQGLAEKVMARIRELRQELTSGENKKANAG